MRMIGSVFFLLCLCCSLYAEDDFSRDTEFHFTISKSSSPGGLSLEETSINTYHYLTEKSLDGGVVGFLESGNAPVDRIRYYLNKDEVYPYAKGWDYIDHPYTFITNTKKHWVRIPSKEDHKSKGDVKIGSTFRVKYYQTYEDIADFPMLLIPTGESWRKLKVEIEFPQGCEIKYNTLSHYVLPAPKVVYTEDKLVVEIDSLPKYDPQYYMPDNNMGLLLFDIYYKGKRVTPRGVDAIQDWLIERIPDYSKSFSHLIEYCATISDSLPPGPTGTTQSRPVGGPEPPYGIGREAAGKVNSLLATLDKTTDNYEKVRTIYGFVQKSVRYVAEHDSAYSYIPHNPSRTLARMTGDCKDLSLLIRSLAAKYGIEIELAIIDTDHLPWPEDLHPTMFNHMFCVWDYQGKMYYLDGTDDYAHLETVPSDMHNLPFVIIDKAYPNVLTTPVEDLLPGTDIRIEANFDSLKTCRATIRLSGIERYRYLDTIDKMNDLDAFNSLSAHLSGKLSTLNIEPGKLVEDDGKTVLIRGKADLSKFIIDSKAKKYVRKAPFLLFDNDLIDRKKDDFPVLIRENIHQRLCIDFGRTALTINPEALETAEGKDFYRSSVTVDKEGNSSFLYEINLHAGSRSRKEKEQFLSLIESHMKRKNDMFVITKEQQ